MAAGRVLHAGLDLLDRQLVDREGRACGKVDDLELEVGSAAQTLYVTALITGGGGLARRLGWRRLGAWLEQFHERFGTGARQQPNRVPTALVSSMGSVIVLALEGEDLATADLERWTRDHVIGRIPGSSHEGE